MVGRARGVTRRYRLDVAARIAAATLGGYGVATLVAIAGAWALPMACADASAAGTIAALLALPVAAMACFAARSATRAWAGTLIAAASFAGVAFAAGWRP